MRRLLLLPVFLVISFLAILAAAQNNDNEEEAKEFLAQYDEAYGLLRSEATKASWNYDTNITDENSQLSQEAWLKVSKFNAEAFKNSSKFDTTGFGYDTKRQLSKVGSKSLSDGEMEELSSVIAKMGDIYGSTKICLSDDRDE